MTIAFAAAIVLVLLLALAVCREAFHMAEEANEKVYQHLHYYQGFSVAKRDDGVIVSRRPSWFARVFLRRKPQTLAFSDVAKRLADAQRENEERLVRDIFESGRAE